MNHKVVVALDAMGGDYAPAETVKGAVEAVREHPEIKVILVGKEQEIRDELGKYTYSEDNIDVTNATEVIDMGEVPTKAIREKKDSSLVVAMNLVRNDQADAVVSAGSTGAILVGGQKNPSVGIVNIGTEEEKGNQLVKETYPLLKECRDINFIGSVEAREIAKGGCDILVCEAFVGNVILKFFEGVALTFLGCIKEGLLSSLRTKIGAVLIKPALRGLLKTFDVSSQGGAPLLGLKGLVVKAHGNSKSSEIKTAIAQCIAFKENSINDKIAKMVQK